MVQLFSGGVGQHRLLSAHTVGLQSKERHCGQLEELSRPPQLLEPERTYLAHRPAPLQLQLLPHS